MDHWFDDLTKQLADGKLSRRTALGRAVKVGIAVAGSRFIGRSGSAEATSILAQATVPRTPTPPTSPTQAGPCIVRQIGPQQQIEYSAQDTFARKPLTLNVTTIFAPSSSILPSRIALPTGHALHGGNVPARGEITQRVNRTTTVIIKLAGGMLIQIGAHFSAGSTDITVTYGSLFSGIKQASTAFRKSFIS